MADVGFVLVKRNLHRVWLGVLDFNMGGQKKAQVSEYWISAPECKVLPEWAKGKGLVTLKFEVIGLDLHNFSVIKRKRFLSPAQAREVINVINQTLKQGSYAG